LTGFKTKLVLYFPWLKTPFKNISFVSCHAVDRKNKVPFDNFCEAFALVGFHEFLVVRVKCNVGNCKENLTCKSREQ